MDIPQRIQTGAIWLMITSATICCAGCSRHEIDYTKSDRNLVVCSLEYPHQDPVPVYVTSRFAALMIWRGQETSFYLYENPNRKIQHTTDFEQFLTMLELLPQHACIQRFDTCCTSLSCDMPENERQRLAQILEKRRITWKINPVDGFPTAIICTCESTGIRYPDAADQ